MAKNVRSFENCVSGNYPLKEGTEEFDESRPICTDSVAKSNLRKLYSKDPKLDIDSLTIPLCAISNGVIILNTNYCESCNRFYPK